MSASVTQRSTPTTSLSSDCALLIFSGWRSNSVIAHSMVFELVSLPATKRSCVMYTSEERQYVHKTSVPTRSFIRLRFRKCLMIISHKFLNYFLHISNSKASAEFNLWKIISYKLTQQFLFMAKVQAFFSFNTLPQG